VKRPKHPTGEPLSRHQQGTPNFGQLRPHIEALMQRGNVVGCYLGHKRKKGRIGKQPALVILVKKKIAPGKLRKSEILPACLPWQFGLLCEKQILTDVREVTSSFHHAAAYWGPGDTLAERVSGTIGIAMHHPVYGNVVTTAGHVHLFTPDDVSYALNSAPQVSLSNAGTGTTISGRLVRAVRNAECDYALVVPDPDSICGNYYCDSSLNDSLLIRYPYTPGLAEVDNSVLYVISRDGCRPTVLRGIGLTHAIDANYPMNNIIITDYATTDGDSGACLIDQQSRAIGLLVGYYYEGSKVYSAFMPAHVPLWNEKGDFL
jgi:hypothetical protein